MSPARLLPCTFFRAERGRHQSRRLHTPDSAHPMFVVGGILASRAIAQLRRAAPSLDRNPNFQRLAEEVNALCPVACAPAAAPRFIANSARDVLDTSR